MNESIDRRLERFVERAVQPVSASRSRKAQIQEELMVHVSTVFDEELGRLGDEEAALAATRERFGLEEELGWQLQDCVPPLESWFLISEREILMSRWFWLLAVVAVAVGPGFVLPALAKFQQDGVMTWGFFLLGLSITVAGIGALGYGIGQRLTRSN
jgi:hypothetical protein